MSTPSDPGVSPSKIKPYPELQAEDVSPSPDVTEDAALDAVSSIQLLGSPSLLPINTSLEQTEMIFDLPDVKSENCEDNQDPNGEVKDWEDLRKFVIKNGNYGGRRYQCYLCGKQTDYSPATMLCHIESMHFRDMFTHTCSICHETFETKSILNQHRFKAHTFKGKF